MDKNKRNAQNASETEYAGANYESRTGSSNNTASNKANNKSHSGATNKTSSQATDYSPNANNCSNR